MFENFGNFIFLLKKIFQRKVAQFGTKEKIMYLTRKMFI